MSTPAPPPAAPEAPRRMTLSQVVEHLLARGSSEHSSVTLSRNSKGETQIEVVVRTDERGEVSSIGDAERIAAETYSRLRAMYPFGGEQAASNGA